LKNNAIEERVAKSPATARARESRQAKEKERKKAEM